LEEILFFLGKPLCGGGEVGEQEPDSNSEKDGHDAFEEKEPLPAREAVGTVDVGEGKR
jgi:hypothetical protein